MINLKAFFYPWNLNLEPLVKSIFLNTIYFAHMFSSSFLDFFKMFGKDFSFIPQNKDKFGYFNSTINDFKFIL